MVGRRTAAAAQRSADGVDHDPARVVSHSWGGGEEASFLYFCSSIFFVDAVVLFFFLFLRAATQQRVTVTCTAFAPDNATRRSCARIRLVGARDAAKRAAVVGAQQQRKNAAATNTVDSHPFLIIQHSDRLHTNSCGSLLLQAALRVSRRWEIFSLSLSRLSRERLGRTGGSRTALLPCKAGVRTRKTTFRCVTLHTSHFSVRRLQVVRALHYCATCTFRARVGSLVSISLCFRPCLTSLRRGSLTPRLSRILGCLTVTAALTCRPCAHASCISFLRSRKLSRRRDPFHGGSLLEIILHSGLFYFRSPDVALWQAATRTSDRPANNYYLSSSRREMSLKHSPRAS